jgi:hypothetical protein
MEVLGGVMLVVFTQIDLVLCTTLTPPTIVELAPL